MRPGAACRQRPAQAIASACRAAAPASVRPSPSQRTPRASSPTRPIRSARAVQLRAWYPATGTDKLARAPYASELDYEASGWPDPQQKALGNAFLNPPAAPARAIRCCCFCQASPGLAMPVALHTSMGEDLASHAYSVVAIEHPYFTEPVRYPDGRIVRSLDGGSLDLAALQNLAATITEDRRFALTWLQQHRSERALPCSTAMDLGRGGA